VIVLDTHVWIWWVSEPEKLSLAARKALEGSKRSGICPISCWEISTKVAVGKLFLDRDVDLWVKLALAQPGLELLELTAEIAVLAGQLGLRGFHGDPADRLIVATALSLGAPLLTKDRQIGDFEGLVTIW
jgi:PIN domain nuclease of toxin-antitoxin system